MNSPNLLLTAALKRCEGRWPPLHRDKLSTPQECRIARSSRDLYQFRKRLATVQNEAVDAPPGAARELARQINLKRDVIHYPELAVKASALHAMGMIVSAWHVLLHRYNRTQEADGMAALTDHLHTTLGQETVEVMLSRFVRFFPTARQYTDNEFNTSGRPADLVTALMVHRLAQSNPAFAPFAELLASPEWEKGLALPAFDRALSAFFENAPHGTTGESILDRLQAPISAAPHSLEGQIEFILKHWGRFLGSFFYELMRAGDLIREEQKVGLTGPGPVETASYDGLAGDPEHFSQDLDWMPRVVLMAKNIYVWLDQLSKASGQPLTRLDQVPDAVLDTLAAQGFTALWLIGIWARSQASKAIKQRCGNAEAEASAYSLWDYEIAEDLGGWPAFENLKQRALKRGIRMAGDMVPNHTGIDGRWVAEHPEWFVGLDAPPFPGYTFEGPDLSSDHRMAIHLEDHYYDRTDAAVVFKHVHRQSGRTRYLYHGNDGTAMPWNDTAQIDFLHPEAREAVMQSILHVARHFPVIRLDAAMTLVKKHVQRLWYPPPGEGGAIASRAEHGQLPEAFERAMPKEFWREVVDRVATETPDTLLLAEAFWMLEGYFVRSLGMHRVYNSAFMNMLKMERNAEYRALIKSTLAFNPEILKRFVNFMNNPDEDTAIAQFGNGDKYFAVCTLLATLPGLPMFGHGQIEGYTEKYGMEYSRAFWDEQPDIGLVARHEKEIFPLLRQRARFAGVTHFRLFDFETAEGVDENVFAYVNRGEDKRTLVLVHNAYASTSGVIQRSVDTGHGEVVSLAEALALPCGEADYVCFKDFRNDMVTLHACRTLHKEGLAFSMDSYQCRVFMDFDIVQATAEQPYDRLCDRLSGRAVPDMAEALASLLAAPVQIPFQQLIEARTENAAVHHLNAWFSALEKQAGLSVEASHKAAVTAGLSAAIALSFSHRPLAVAWVLLSLPGEEEGVGLALMHRWRLDEVLLKNAGSLTQPVAMLRLLLLLPRIFFQLTPFDLVATLLAEEEGRTVLGVNRHENVLWFHGESMAALLETFEVMAPVMAQSESDFDLKDWTALVHTLRHAADASGYRVETLLEQLRDAGA